MEKKGFKKEIKERWKSESPIFWKKVMKIAIIIGTSSASIIGGDQLFNLQSYGVPAIIFTICSYIVTACLALGLAAKITKQ